MIKRTFLSPPTIFPSVHEQMNVFWREGYISTTGPHIERFENEMNVLFEKEGNVTLALNSATSAIHLGLKNLDVQAGDMVLCQSLNFIACVNPILYQQAVPVFIDSEKESWNMDPEQLIQAIDYCLGMGRKPKAVIAVHIYGMPFKIKEIRSIADSYQIPLLEDAAEALGSKYDNIPVGGFGDQSVFSFNGNKIISAAGGGVLISKLKPQRDRAKFWSTQSKEDAKGYLHKEVGYNYRISNIQAAIGVGMLPHLEELVSDRRRIFEQYKSALEQLIDFQPEALGARSNRWLTAGLCANEDLRDKVIQKLEEHGIEARPVWRPMHVQPLCKDMKFFGSGVAEDLWKRGICLPSGYGLDPSPIIKIVKEVLG